MPAQIIDIITVEGKEEVELEDMAVEDIDAYVLSMLGNDDESFEMQTEHVRPIPERAPLIKRSQLVEGHVYDCWSANEGEWYPATCEMVTESGTVMVTYEGFDEQDEVPLLYLALVEDLDKDFKGHSVSFIVTLADLTVDDFTEDKQFSFKESLAGSLGVSSETQVEVVSCEAGSAIVESQIVKLESEDVANEMAKKVSELAKEGTLLDADEFGDYCVSDVDVFNDQKPEDEAIPNEDADEKAKKEATIHNKRNIKN